MIPNPRRLEWMELDRLWDGEVKLDMGKLHEGLDGGLPPAMNRAGDGEVVVVELELKQTRDCKSPASGG
jgi:hypothetical protein